MGKVGFVPHLAGLFLRDFWEGRSFPQWLLGDVGKLVLVHMFSGGGAVVIHSRATSQPQAAGKDKGQRIKDKGQMVKDEGCNFAG